MEKIGWISIHKKILDWEWYSDSNTFRVFFDLLLTANFEATRYMGHVIERGETVIGRKEMAKRLGISEQNVRSAIKHLKSTNEITIKVTNKFSIINVVNYSKYQDKEGRTNQQANQQANQQLTNNQPTTNHTIRNKEYKELNKSKDRKSDDFLPELLKTEPEEVAKQNTTTLPPVAVAPSQYGNQEVNQMLSFLLGVFGRKDFKETKQFQRNFGKHLVNLYKKMGKEAFKDAIQCIAKDSFKSKNCNSLKYIYGEIKSAKVTTGYIEPTEQERVLNPIGYV